MAIGRTAADLVASIQRRCFMKPSDPDFTSDDITAMINEQVGAYLYDLMRPYAQNYAVQTLDQPLVAGQQTYALPDRAVNGTLEALGIVDPTGKSPGYRLQLLDLQDSVLMQKVSGSTIPVAYSYESNAIRLWPTPGTISGAQNTLRIQYMQRASELVDVSFVAVLSGALSNVTGSSYRVNINGTAPAAFTVGARVELVGKTAGYSTFTPSGVIAATGAGFVDVTGTAPVAPQTPGAGDYLCLYDQAPVLTNVPLEFQECLLQWVAIKMMEAKGDQAAVDRMGRILGISESNLRRQLTQRNTGARRFMSAWAGFAGAPVRGQLWPLAQPGP